MIQRAIGVLTILALTAVSASAEMLAILNYETKAKDSLASLDLQNAEDARREGIAIVELDSSSPDYGKIISDIPLSPDLVLHHIFYNRDLTKAYVTSLGKEILHVVDLKKWPYRLRKIPTPGCSTQENIILSDDNKTWYLTCMGSSKIVFGDAVTDTVRKIVDMPGSYPHGITLHEGIDRLLVPSCVAPDMSAVGHTIEVVKASTGEHLGGIQVSDKEGSAPVEAVFVPKAKTPTAYVTVMMEDGLWAATWNADKETFETQKVFDFGTVDAHMPLEIYFNRAVDRLYVTTAKPGHFHVFDISESPLRPKLIKQIATAGGAHHVAFTPNEKVAYVQNALLNIPGINDGSITVIDLEKGNVIDTIDVFKSQGLAPNSITMLPRWYHPAGHFNNGPGDLY
ncbi:MAG: YncE family protein [Pseudomonadales bacterium]